MTLLFPPNAGLPASLLLALALLFAPIIGLQGAQAQSEIGVAAAVRGAVEVRSGGASRAPSGGEAMLLGDRVLTQRASGMQVLLLDESVFTIGEGNDLTIDRFVYNPDRSTGELAARATTGFLRFVSGGIGALAPQNISLQTPSATIGVRGTSVDIIIGQAAIDLARQAGLIAPGAVVDPQSAVFVILRGPSTSFDGITQRGRITVTTPAGSVEVRREGYGVFVPFAGAAPSQAVPVPRGVDLAVVQAIELPGVGLNANLTGVDITGLPQIDGFGPEGLSLPQPGDASHDRSGTRFGGDAQAACIPSTFTPC
jgi:hypothetical protein